MHNYIALQLVYMANIRVAETREEGNWGNQPTLVVVPCMCRGDRSRVRTYSYPWAPQFALQDYL